MGAVPARWRHGQWEGVREHGHLQPPDRLAHAGSGLTITVAADPTWLADPARQYPVLIDPTVTTYATGMTNSGAYTYLSSASPTTPMANGYTFTVAGTTTEVDRALIPFNLSSIPSNVEILNAKMTLTRYTNPQNMPTSAIDLLPVTRAWTSSATWRNATSSQPWTTQGGDYSTPAAATTQVGTTNTDSWYPTSLVQSWVNGTLPNDGLIVRNENEADGTSRAFCGYICGNGAPQITITYQPWTGIQGFYGTISHTLSDRMTLDAVVTNGNLELENDDLSMPGSVPVTVSRYYNSLNSTNRDIGNKWTLDTGADVGLTIFSDGSVDYVGPSGYQTPFIKRVDGSFASPPAIGGFLTAQKDAAGNTISFGYNASNLPTTITDPQGRVTTFSYNASNLISQMTDSAGRNYLYGYSGSNLTSYTDPAGKVTSYSYDANNNMTGITDPNGSQTAITYDASGRVASIKFVTNPATGAGNTWTFSYNSGNTVVTDPNNHSVTYNYDAYGRDTSTVNPLSESWRTTWTGDSQVQTATSPQNETTTTSYDSSNNVTQVQLPTGAKGTASYSNANLPYDPTSITDPQGNATSISWNSNQTIASVTDPLNHTSSATYNSSGSPATSTDPRGNTTTYGYTSGLPASETPPSPLGGTTVDYNSYNLPWHVVDGDGQRAVNSYDVMGRVTGIGYPGGLSFGYSYDSDGNLTASSDINGSTTTTTTYQYDALSRQTQETLPNNQTISYTYDGVDNLLTVTDSGGTIHYAYNADSQVTSITDRQNQTTTFTYDSDGNEILRTFPSGAAEHHSYDAAGDLTRVWTTNSSQALTWLGMAAMSQGDMQTALSRFSESRDLARVANMPWAEATALSFIVEITALHDDVDEVRSMAEEALQSYRALHDAWGTARMQKFLAGISWMEGDYGTAHRLCAEAVTLLRDVGERWNLARGLARLGIILMDEEEHEEAEASLTESLLAWRDLGNETGMILSLAGLTAVAAAQGRTEQAQRLYASEPFQRSVGGVMLDTLSDREFNHFMDRIRGQLGDRPPGDLPIITLEEAVSDALDEPSTTVSRSREHL